MGIYVTMDDMKELVFLKLGGSLITDKMKPYTPRLDVMDALAAEIQSTIQTHPDLRLIIGHGAGSFGHVPASEYHTRDGLPPTPKATPLVYRRRDESEDNYWKGFAEVWYQTSELNKYVVNALHKADVRTMSFSPAASVIASEGKVSSWDTTQIRMALSAGIVPIIQGDVIFDEVRGGTILSTEDLFMYLTHQLEPERLLLAGIEKGVWADFPERTKLVERITPTNFDEFKNAIGKSAAADVTGGMESKVKQMLGLVKQTSISSVLIFSGEEQGNIKKALSAEPAGTLITI